MTTQQRYTIPLTVQGSKYHPRALTGILIKSNVLIFKNPYPAEKYASTLKHGALHAVNLRLD